MDIYVDESGSFVVPSAPGGHRIVGVVALAIPSGRRTALFRRFRKTHQGWGDAKSRNEIKGSQLTEAQIAEVIKLLAAFDAVVEVVLTDMGLYAEQDLQRFKDLQAAKLVEHITPDHTPEVAAEVEQRRIQMLGLSSQLFVQSHLILQLLPEVLQTATVYYALRLPQELGNFEWVVDAKGKNITPSEDLWSSLLLPVLQSEGFRRPLVTVKEGDYGWFRPFEIRESEVPPEDRQHIQWVKAQTPGAQGSEYHGVDVGRVFKNVRFADDTTEPGLQLVDIVASAICRAFNGNLDVSGWGEVGSLIVARNEGSIRMVALRSDANAGEATLEPQHIAVRSRIASVCKSMLP